MTIHPKLRAFGSANIDRRVETDGGHESDRREGMRPQSPWPSSDVEDTDLERRVLANECILRALNAYVAEAGPKIVSHLGAVFSEPPCGDHREHDFTDTHVDQFGGKVLRFVECRDLSGEAPEAMRSGLCAVQQHAEAGADAFKGRPITRLEVKHRVGIWEVTRDGHFYGHYQEAQPAFDAAEAAALAIVANGGSADLLWNDTRPRPSVSDPTRNVVISQLSSRIIEFRPGSTTIMRPRLQGAP